MDSVRMDLMLANEAVEQYSFSKIVMYLPDLKVCLHNHKSRDPFIVSSVKLNNIIKYPRYFKNIFFSRVTQTG